MLNDMMQRLCEYFQPQYTLEQFIEEYKPQNNHELERLEKIWMRMCCNRQWWF